MRGRSYTFLRLALWLLVAVVLGLSFSFSPELLAQEKAPQEKEESADIEMNFRNVELINFLSAMSTALGIAFIWDEKDIRGKITLVSPRNFKRTDAFKIFQTVLALQGYTTIRTKGSPVVQVVPIKDAPRIPTPTRTARGTQEEGNAFLTQIIPLRFADANLVRAALTPIISKSAALAVYTPGNLLVLADTESNIQRILDVVEALDVARADIEFKVIPLKFATAKRLAPILTSVLGAIPGAGKPRTPGKPRAAGAGGSKVVADERTNSLIVVGDKPTLSTVSRIIAELDVSSLVPDTGIKVYRLKFADAEELEKIFKSVKETAGDTRKRVGKAASAAAPVSINADKATNSIIVFGPPETIKLMDELVSKLDVRRLQVFVEVLIMEMTLEKSLQLGINWRATAQVGDEAVLGLGFPGATPQTLPQALSSGSGAVLGVLGNTIQFQGQEFLSFSAFIQATRQDQDINILANPQLLTMNNEEAEINISQVVPVSARVSLDANQRSTTEFEFKDIGIILKITPKITGGNQVQLDIQQESSSVAARQAELSANQQAITTLKRTISTKVLVDDNSTIAIGGLIQDQRVETITKVPCLGDIPVLGFFFRSRSEVVRKTNLIVFIRPRIVTSRAELEGITSGAQGKYDRSRTLKGDTESLLRESLGIPAPPEDEETGESPPDEDAKSGEGSN